MAISTFPNYVNSAGHIRIATLGSFPPGKRYLLIRMGQKPFWGGGERHEEQSSYLYPLFFISLELERVIFPACLEASRGILQLTPPLIASRRAGALWGWRYSASPICFPLPSPWGPVVSRHSDRKTMNSDRGPHALPTKRIYSFTGPSPKLITIHPNVPCLY